MEIGVLIVKGDLLLAEREIVLCEFLSAEALLSSHEFFVFGFGRQHRKKAAEIGRLGKVAVALNSFD